MGASLRATQASRTFFSRRGSLEWDRLNTIFAPAEQVQKSAEDLSIRGVSPQLTEYNVGAITLGYVRELAGIHGGSLGVGMAGTLNAVVPSTLEAAYGSRTPLGGTIFLRLRPRLMNMGMHRTATPSMQMDNLSDMHDAHGGIQ